MDLRGCQACQSKSQSDELDYFQKIWNYTILLQYFSRTHHAWSGGKFLFPCQENEGSGSKRLHSLFLRCTFCTGKFCTWSDYFFTYETGFLPDLYTVGYAITFCLTIYMDFSNQLTLWLIAISYWLARILRNSLN